MCTGLLNGKSDSREVADRARQVEKLLRQLRLASSSPADDMDSLPGSTCPFPHTSRSQLLDLSLFSNHFLARWRC